MSAVSSLFASSCTSDKEALQIQDLGKPSEFTAGYDKGVSAPFCGAGTDFVLTAGGANFPDIPVTEGGKKKFYNDIFVITEKGWHKVGELPMTLAYGCSFSLNDRVITVGGSNSDGATDKVFSLAPSGEIVKELTPFPVKFDQAGFAGNEKEFYVAGGVVEGKPSDLIYKGILDGDDVKWQEFARLPLAMVQPVVCLINNSLYVWGGCNPATGEVHSEGFRIDLDSRECLVAASVPENGTFTGSAISVLNSKAVVIGGVNKEVFTKGLAARTAEEKHSYMTMSVEDYKFNDKIWVYNPSEDKWSIAGVSQKTALAGAGMTASGDSVYIIGGELKPGIRTDKSWKLSEIKF